MHHVADMDSIPYAYAGRSDPEAQIQKSTKEIHNLLKWAIAVLLSLFLFFWINNINSISILFIFNREQVFNAYILTHNFQIQGASTILRVRGRPQFSD